MHPTTRALLEAISRVLDVQPVQSDSAAVLAASTASAAWNAAGRPDLKPLVGGDPPEPWPGMGVEMIAGAGVTTRFLLQTVRLEKSGWRGWAVSGSPPIELSNVVAYFDGRARVWRRE